MPSSEAISNDAKIVFASANDSFSLRDLIDSASFRGELGPIWQELLRMIEAEKAAEERELEVDDSEIDAAAERFRYEHDLITAEETEQWLETRGLTLVDFSAYFVRHYWDRILGEEVNPEALDYFSAPEELRELFSTELILSGQLNTIADCFSRRVATAQAAADNRPSADLLNEERTRFLERNELNVEELPDWLRRIGRDETWLDQAFIREALYRKKCEALLTKQACEREVSGLRLPLTRFDVETVELDALDAAREALLCVRQDGLSMEEVATEGRYPYRRIQLLLEDVPEDLQQKFLSVRPGDILEPVARGDGFYLCRIIDKAEPTADDPAVKERAERRILDRYFSELCARHIQWRNFVNFAP